MALYDKNKMREKAMEALQRDPSLFCVIKSSLITSEMARYAIYHDPENIFFIKAPSFELCQIAVNANPRTILMIPPKFQNVLKIEACSKDPTLLEHFGNFRYSELEEIVENNPSSIRYIKNAPERLIQYAIQLNPNVALYYSEEYFDD